MSWQLYLQIRSNKWRRIWFTIFKNKQKNSRYSIDICMCSAYHLKWHLFNPWSDPFNYNLSKMMKMVWKCFDAAHIIARSLIFLQQISWWWRLSGGWVVKPNLRTDKQISTWQRQTTQVASVEKLAVLIFCMGHNLWLVQTIIV